MVSPLPGKYESSPTHRPALSRSLHHPGTVTFPADSATLRALRPCTPVAAASLSRRPTPVASACPHAGRAGPGEAGPATSARLLIYIRHASAWVSPASFASPWGPRSLLTSPETRGYLRWGDWGAWRQVGTCRGDQGSRARGVRRPAVEGVGGSGLESGFTFFLLKLTRNRMSIGS